MNFNLLLFYMLYNNVINTNNYAVYASKVMCLKHAFFFFSYKLNLTILKEAHSYIYHIHRLCIHTLYIYFSKLKCSFLLFI